MSEGRLTPWQAANRDFLSENFARKMGLKSRAATRHEVDHKKAMALYKRGLTDLNIADLLGVSKGDVYKWRKDNGLTSNMIRSRGPSSPSRKTPPKK